MTLVDFHTHKPTAEGVITPRSFGIHPWYVEQEGADSLDVFSGQHGAQFAAADIVGECGLDKACGSYFDRQCQLFEWQLTIAERLMKPVVVHCVRAFNELLLLRKRFNSTTWVIHGFVGSPQLAAQLNMAGILVSFGAALLDPRRSKVAETFRTLSTPFFLETDDSDCGIEKVYRAAAAIKGLQMEDVSSLVYTNYLHLLD